MEIVAEWGRKSGKILGDEMRAMIRAQSTFEVMGSEDIRRVKGFEALLAAVYGSDFETEERGKAIAWKLFWTLRYSQSIKKARCAFSLLKLTRKRKCWSKTFLF